MWVGRDPSHRIDAYILDTSFDRPVIAYDYDPHMDDVGLHVRTGFVRWQSRWQDVPASERPSRPNCLQALGT